MGSRYQYKVRRFSISTLASISSPKKQLLSFLFKQWGIPIVSTILILCMLAACGNEDEPTADQPMNSGTNPDEDIVITIGNLTDQTGVASTAMDRITKALEDTVQYFNQENLIPGITIEIVTYDGKYDPSKDIPGYEYLIDRGADIIFAPCPPTAITLEPVVREDKIPMFIATTTLDILTPPGYTFDLGIISEYDAYTFLKWIAENDWDYHKNGPAKIGGAAWSDFMSNAQFDAMEEYAAAHPEQFEWVGGYLTDFGFIWDSQIEALKDCDYLYPPVPMHVFVDGYRDAGYDAKFIGIDPHAGFLDMIDKGEYWDEIDGMLFIRGSRWWTEQGKLIDLTKELLYENHPDEAESIIRSGVGYLAVPQIYQLCNIIKNAAESVGPENLNSQAIYDAAVNYIEVVDGLDRYSFDENKRVSINFYVIYEVDGEKRDLFRIDPEWVPLETTP